MLSTVTFKLRGRFLRVPKVIVFNGPPGCGKDEAANHLNRLYFKASHKRFKDKLFEITAILNCVDRQDLEVTWYTRELKEQPREELNGRSPRGALIHTSEDVVKPHFGKDFFGKALAESITTEITFVSDSGFLDELLPVINKVGAENVLVVRVIRPGYTFVGDSRDFLSHVELKKLGVEYKDIVNKSTLEDFKQEVQDYVSNWIQRKESV